MSKFIALLMCLVFPMSAFAGDNGYKIAYDGAYERQSRNRYEAVH